MDKNKAGLALGSFLGLFHLLWGTLVAMGAAQSLLNFIFWAHFLDNPSTIQPFGFGRSIILIVVTSAVGYVFGWSFASLWNKFQD